MSDDSHGTGARVLGALEEAGTDLTLAEIADRTGLHPNAVRRNLARLADDGRVHATPAPPEPGRRGRPALHYRAVGPPDAPYRELMPLVLLLLGGPGAGVDPASRMRAAREAGRRHGREHAPAGDAVEAVTATLASLGFAPARCDGAPEGNTDISLTACPFAGMVTGPGGRALCALHHGILEGVAEARGGQVADFHIVDPNVDRCRVRLDG